MSGGRLRRWTRLALGLLGMGLAVLALNVAGGSAGPVIEESRQRDLEADAYFYTEVSDVSEFLGEEGRYRQSTRDE